MKKAIVILLLISITCLGGLAAISHADGPNWPPEGELHSVIIDR